MNDLVDILTPLITLVGFAVVIYNLNGSIKNNKRIDEKEIELRATQQAEMNMTIRKVSSDVESIIVKLDKTDARVDKTDGRVDDLCEKMVAVESGLKECAREYSSIRDDIKAIKEDLRK